MTLRRRSFAAGMAGLVAVTLLAGCGFKLRSSQNFAFQTVAVTPERGAGVAAELTRYLGEAVRPVAPRDGGAPPEAIVDILQELREKTVVGVNASGQVREFQLRIKVKFRMRTPKGVELIAPTEIVQQRDISFNESAVLAKEAEEALLYRDMQTDIVQQLLRRLAAVKSLD
ncbi:MAG TPA: LPS assembly lipoprotein LptE [Rhodoferax sp.]|nr:LPS assembly lipoprotein LptE [Rhodoferax sp.]